MLNLLPVFKLSWLKLLNYISNLAQFYHTFHTLGLLVAQGIFCN